MRFLSDLPADAESRAPGCGERSVKYKPGGDSYDRALSRNYHIAGTTSPTEGEKREPRKRKVPSVTGRDLTVWRLGRAVTRGELWVAENKAGRKDLSAPVIIIPSKSF